MRTRRVAVVAALAAASLMTAPTWASADTSAATSSASPDGGTFTDLGAPLTSLTIMQGVMGRDADGSDVIYAVPAGENAQLNVVDVHTNQLKRAIPLPGASGSWAITVASDNSVYIGTYSNGHLYRYQPGTGTVADLGQPIPGEQFLYGLTAGENGTVYAGTYPHAHAFQYDPATGKVTDYGSLDSVQQYVRGVAYDPDNHTLYAGLDTPKARLFSIDVTTGAKQEITPAGFTGSGFYDLNYADGRLFGHVSGQLVVFDTATGQQLTYTDGDTGASVTQYPMTARGVSPASDGSVYFTTAGNVMARYDIATDTVHKINYNGKPVVSTRGAFIGYGWVTESGHQVLYGLAGNYSGGTFRFDPTTDYLGHWSSPFAYVPVPLMNAIVDPSDGRVIVDAFLNGSAGFYDPATGKTAAAPRLGQIEDWNWAPDGTLYYGIYPYGRLLAWHPHSPATSTNPQTLFSLVDSDEQNRPVAVVPSNGKVYVGTTPGYGVWGGALTVYDPATGAHDVHRNIVTDQTVASLLPVGDLIYGGSSVDGGQGTDPKATDARLFVYDPATGTKTAEYIPFPGVRSINALTLGPDGNIWGLADGTVFAFNPATHTVVRRIPVFTGTTGAQDGALVWRDGYLYGVAGGRLFVVDSLAGTGSVLHDGGLLRLAPAADGTMYTLMTPAGSVNTTNLASFKPPADTCPNSDLRATVWAGGVDSGVANRFASYGCTVTDDLPATTGWSSHGAYVAAVTKVVNGLVADHVITSAEGDAIVAAAGRSNVGGQA